MGSNAIDAAVDRTVQEWSITVSGTGTDGFRIDANIPQEKVPMILLEVAQIMLQRQIDEREAPSLVQVPRVH